MFELNSIFSTIVTNWLRFLAQLQLKKVHPLIIGVTGSSGKSSAVRAIGIVLSEKYKVKVGKKGNSETGIPMEILDIPVDTYSGSDWISVCLQAFWTLLTNWKQYEVLILEMGIDSDKPPKNMEYLLSIVQPQISVFLSLSSVHGQNFEGKDTLQSIADEKGKILTHLNSTDIAIYSLDYPQIVKVAKKTVAMQLTFSVESNNRNADIRLTCHNIDEKGTTFIFDFQGKEFKLHFQNQLHFKESFGTFASALIIAHHQNVPLTTAINLLQDEFKSPPGRMTIIEGIRQSTIIDSSYNSSLTPTVAALKMLDQLEGRKIVVLGDMRELGRMAEHDHIQLAIEAQHHADVIILVGPLTHQFALPKLRELRFLDDKLMSFTNAYEAADALLEIVQHEDIILVKGSQNTIFLEIVVKALMAHPEDASNLLCRQSKYWEKQRQKMRKLQL